MAMPKGPGTKLVQPKTRKGKRVLEARAPKLVEDAKRALVLMGNKTSQTIKDVLTDLTMLKKPDVVRFTRKNEDILPFEPGNEGSLEHFAAKSDCAVFALGNHTKKRPHNLTLGRFFDARLYDLLELGVTKHAPLKSFTKPSVSVGEGHKPAFIFIGDKFESLPEMKLAKSMLLDFFRGEETDKFNLKSLSHVFVITALNNKEIMLRRYGIKMKKSGTKIPRIELEEIGPAFDLTVRRHRLPAHDMEKEALTKPLVGKRKEKNISHDKLDGRVGRIYMPKQDVQTMATAKFKGKKRKSSGEEGSAKKSKAAPEAAEA